MSGVHDSAARLQAAAERILTEVLALPEELIDWKPAPDVWSVKQIVCHVAEFVPYWTSQALQVVRRPDEPWGRTHTDTARLDAVQEAASRSLNDALDEVRTAAKKSAAALRELRDEDLATEALSRNPRWGRKPASFVVEHLLIEHLEKHIGQVQRNVKEFRERGANRA